MDLFERLMGSIRRECLDHIIVSGEAHLRRIQLRQNASVVAPIFPPIQQIGIIRSHPILGGLHHNHVRV